LLARANEPDVAEILASEKRLFGTRRVARLGQNAQLKQRIKQLENEVKGLEAQQAANIRFLKPYSARNLTKYAQPDLRPERRYINNHAVARIADLQFFSGGRTFAFRSV
jgi:hypothetical protein